jgi:hypothetical protein
MSQRMPGKLQFAVIAVAALVGVGAILVWYLTPRPKRYEAIEGRPLLAQDGKEFLDEQVGLRFTPPADWAMQARSTEAPTHLPERRVVKYKLFSPSRHAAWMRLWVKDVAEGMTPVEMLRNSKPPEPGWKPQGEIEGDLQIGGAPAARRTFGGPLDHDGRGNKDFRCEIVAVKRGGRLFEFSGTYFAGDEQAQREIRQTMTSVVFLPE